MFNPILHYEFGKQRTAFVSTWKTDNLSTGSSTNTQVKLPLNINGIYNFRVDWGDGNSDTITVWNQAQTTHTYSATGTYTIRITGTCKGWSFNNTGDRLKILNVSQWGKLILGNLSLVSGYFHGCANLNLSSVTDVLDFTGVTTLMDAFNGCTTLTTINRSNEWNISTINSLARTFASCTNFNGNIISWITSAVTSLNNTFLNCVNFNQNLGSWITSAVTNMSNTFQGASIFNNGGSDSIKNWITSSVTAMAFTFNNASAFNQPLLWDVSLVTTMQSMFNGATAFNQNIGAWLIGNVSIFTSFMASKTPATFSTANLDAIYNGWSALPSVKPNISINFGTAKYTAASSAGRAILTGAPNNWSITDGGI